MKTGRKKNSRTARSKVETGRKEELKEQWKQEEKKELVEQE